MNKYKYIEELTNKRIKVIPLLKNSKIPMSKHLTNKKWNEQTLEECQSHWYINKNSMDNFNFGWLLDASQVVIDIDFVDSKGRTNKLANQFYEKFKLLLSDNYGRGTDRGFHFYFKTETLLNSRSTKGVELLTNKKQVVIYPSTGFHSMLFCPSKEVSVEDLSLVENSIANNAEFDNAFVFSTDNLNELPQEIIEWFAEQRKSVIKKK